jgi:hypothetical protein
MKIGHPKDFWGGVLFAAIGMVFLVIARGVPGVPFLPGYTMGTPARMGPAFFPFWLGVLLFLLGVAISVVAIRTDGGEEAKLEKWHWGPLLWVIGAIVLFGVVLKIVGMLIAGTVLVIVASMGSHDFKFRPVLILAVSLSIFCALVFVAGLKLPIPLCPDIESLQQFAVCRA